VGINGTRAMTAFNSKEGGFYRPRSVACRRRRSRSCRARGAHTRLQGARTTGSSTPRLPRRGRVCGRWFDEASRSPRTTAKQGPSGSGTGAGRRDTRKMLGKRAWPPRNPACIAALADAVRPHQPAARGQRSLRFSLRTTLSLAQALYERHKALTYPRTDARALPEDYIGT